MSNKSFLVAQREFLENVRTKAFWIGILVFPVMLTLAFIVPSFFDRAKAAREYVVIDHSGWLLEAVEERATLPDLEKVLREAVRRVRKGGEAAATLPNALRETATQLNTVLASMVDQDGGESPMADNIYRGFAGLLSGVGGAEGGPLASLGAGQAEQVIASLNLLKDEIRRWWHDLPADQAKEFADGRTAKGRYARIPVEGSDEAVIQDLNRRVGDGELFAYFVINADPVEGAEGAKYVSANLTDDDLRDWFQRLASETVRDRRLAQENINPEIASWVQEPLRFAAKQVGKGGIEKQVEARDMVRQWAPAVFVYLLWMAIFTIANMLMTNTIEEKSNRIMEVLLSSVSPIELMAGKIMGIAATGLTLVGSWVLFFIVGSRLLPRLLGLDLDFDLTVITADPFFMVSFVVYFVLGYLFYAAVLVGIGSVCNSLKEAQNLMGPIMLVMFVPLMTMMPIVEDPNGTLAKVLSYIPPFTPFVMMNRAAAPPTGMEYLVSTLVLLIAVGVALWAAAKVFRIGILMTGKPPKIREIFQWLRAPVGLVPERDQS